ncbi:MAG: hypothetical protein UHJ11_01105 [Paludibacteraceae bacterium]|nr:hypothetical protein [Paludibacteraceae bacterium]
MCQSIKHIKEMCVNKCCFWKKNPEISEETKADNITFTPLTPTDEAKDCGAYMDALSWALKQNTIHNIAISGPYGSGKSSVIRTFFSPRSQHSQYKHLTISLATFSGQKVGDTPELQSRLIESSILEQLFYHEEDSHIPDSRFKKIRKQHRGKLFVYALASVIFSLLLIFLFRPSLLSTWLTGTTIPATGLIWFNRVALGLCTIGAVYVLYKLARIVIGLSVKRLNFKSAEVEIENNTQKSVLNSHIDEIIYFFEVTGYQIVVLEDLDRFDNQDIFIKLREINYIINNSDKVKQKVIFIYAIKDDMFVDSKDRTKFFDFIIPIIAVINYSNSGEILRRELQVSDNTPKNDTSVIHEAIIDQLSLFIDDLRLLYNIINEYKIYRNRLSAPKESDEQATDLHLIADRLLAIITYKNLYPQDFSDLAQGKGLLYRIISSKKDTYINAAIDKCNKEITEKEKKIQEIENSNRPFSATELRYIYINKIAEELHNYFVCFVIDGKRRTKQECAESEELFNTLISRDKIDFIYFNPSYYREYSDSPRFNFHNIENKVHELTYQQRLDLLYRTELEELKKQIRTLRSNIEEYKQFSLVDLMSEGKYTIDSKQTKGYPQQQIDFLNIVLRAGYINENYWEYISVFYPGSLTYEDKQFVLDVFAGRSNSYDYHLNLVENVLKKITKESTKYLKTKAALNFELMDYIASDRTIAYTDPYMGQMSAHPDFVLQYIERGKSLGNFISLLCSYWPNFWQYILSHKEIDKYTYLKLIIKYALEEDIVSIFKKCKHYLEEYPDFLMIETGHEKLHNIISELELEFVSLNHETESEELEYIYSQGYYQINTQMLYTLLSHQNNWEESKFQACNYDYIIETFTTMVERIQSNLSEYIDNVYLTLKARQNITSAHFVELMNSENLSEDQKKKIINKSLCKVENIEDITDSSLRTEICRQDMMSATWSNISAMMVEDTDTENALNIFISIKENVQQLLEEAEQDSEHTPEIMNFLVQQKSIDVSERKQLFIKFANVITDIEPFLKSLGKPYSDLVEREEMTYIPTEDKKLLNALKEVEYITKYLFVPGNKMYYVRNEFIK